MDDTARLAAIDATISQYIRLVSEVGGSPTMASVLHMGLMPLVMQATQEVEDRMDNDDDPDLDGPAPEPTNGADAWWAGQGAHALQLVTDYIAGKLQAHTAALHQAMDELDEAEAELVNEEAAIQAQFPALAGGVLQHLHDDEDEDEDGDEEQDGFEAFVPPAVAVANPNPFQAPQAGPSTAATTTAQTSTAAQQPRRSSTGSAFLDTALERSPADFRREFCVTQQTFDYVLTRLETVRAFRSGGRKHQRPAALQLATYLLRHNGLWGYTTHRISTKLGISEGSVYLYCKRVKEAATELGVDLDDILLHGAVDV